MRNIRDRIITITGVTLPGVPAMVVGSNGHVAWGFTNSYGDWVDLVLLHLNPDDPDQYQTADGWRHFEHHPEIIRVQASKRSPWTCATPSGARCWARTTAGVPRAVHWMAADPGRHQPGTGRTWIGHATCRGHGRGQPRRHAGTEFHDGGCRRAYRLDHRRRIPVRSGFDPGVACLLGQARHGLDGWLPPERYPRMVDPADGRLWTANARVVDGAMLAQIGDGGYDLGARAQQIRDDLMAKERFSPADMLAIQLDDRAVFLARWRSLLLHLLTPENIQGDPNSARSSCHYVEDWGGRASVDSVGYRLVREFRASVEDGRSAR